MKKKRSRLLTAFIVIFSMMMLSFSNVYADGYTLPDGAPFTAIYIGAGSPLDVASEAKTVNEQSVTLYTVTVPEGAGSAVVFFPMELGIYDESYGVIGSSFTESDLIDNATELQAAPSEDGVNVMVMIPVDEYLSEDESWICPMKADDGTLVCAFTFKIHNHNFSNWEYVNDRQHKRVCESAECSNFTETEGHTWKEPEVITAAGEYSTGRSQYICSKCNFQKTEITLPTSGKIKVSNAGELVDFANNAPVGVGILLTDDIDLTGVEWTGIPKFSGDFDGQGHTIRIPNGTNGLFVTVAGKSKTNRAKIEDVTIEGNISGNGCVGGIAGTAYNADFTNCFNNASVSASYGGNFTEQGVGGIVGKAEQNPTVASSVSFTNCGNDGTISGNTAVGGIYGYCKAGGVMVDSCYNKGTIRGSSQTVTSGGTGGIAGYSQGYRESSTFINVYNAGLISGKTGVGGLIGSMYNGTKISNAYNSGTVNGSSLTGAIAGNVYDYRAVAENCYYLDTSCDQAASGSTAESTGSIAADPKSRDDLSDALMIDLLGTSFDASLSYPVLVWENYDSEGTTYSISAPNVEGVTFTGPKLASSKKAYNFKVTIDRYHKLTDDFAVKINDEIVEPVEPVSGDPLSPEGAVYSFTVAQPSCDMIISVEGVVSAKTQIYKYGSYPKPIEVDYISAIDVYNVEVTEIEVDGSDINVILASDTPLDQKIPFTVSRGGMFRTIVTPGTAFDGQLVEGKLTAEVTAVSKAISTNPSYTWKINVNIGYSITKEPQDKVTINGKDQAVRGSDYTFTLEFDPRYSPSDNFVVKVDDNVVTPDDGGTYKIENVQGPHTITTSGDLNLITFDRIIAVNKDSTEKKVAEYPADAPLGFYDIKLGFFPTGSFGAKYYGVPYYHIIVPKDTEKVKIVYPKGTWSSVHGQKHINENNITETLSDDAYWSSCRVKVNNKVPQDCNTGNTWDIGYTAYTVDGDGNKVIELDISKYLINKDDEGTGTGFSVIGETGEGKLGLYGVISFEILQEAVITKKPTANTLTYNASAQALVTAGEAEGGTMQYALGTETEATGTWTATPTDITGTDAGTYYVWYKVVGDEYHSDTEPAPVTVRIGKLSLTITAAGASKTFDGTALTKNGYFTTGLVEGDRITSIKITGSITSAGSAPNTASDAVIKNSAGEDVTDKYEITYRKGTLVVVKKSVSVKADDKTKVYDNDPATDPELTATVTGEVKGCPVSYTLSREKGQAVGSYKITVTAGKNPNYVLSVTDAELTITEGTAPVYGEPDFTLPGAIKTIEDNAFEGGAMSIVYIPDPCTAIGAGAFKDCAKLTQIRLPKNCELDDTIFDGCGKVYVFAPAGGTTESWCQGKDNIVFVGMDN